LAPHDAGRGDFIARARINDAAPKRTGGDEEKIQTGTGNCSAAPQRLMRAGLGSGFALVNHVFLRPCL
jgi:hypothetical protein